MRNKILLSAGALVVIALSMFLVLSCEKPVSISNTNSQGQSYTPNASQAPLAPANICTCSTKPSGCPTWVNCAKKILVNNINSRDFTINWISCSGCGGNVPPSSTGMVCYSGECDYLNVQLNNLPDCLQNCYGNIGCVKAKLTCSGSSYQIQYVSTDGSQIVTITGDPHIHIECTYKGVTYACDGDLVYN